MYWGVLIITSDVKPNGDPFTQITAVAHNLRDKEYANRVLEEMAQLVRSSPDAESVDVRLSLFSHTLMHDRYPDIERPENCPGCHAAISERMAILEETRRAEDISESHRRRAATEAAASSGSAVSVGASQVPSFRPRQSTSS